MSRLSEYTDADILQIIQANHYRRLGGTHKNGQSIHVLKHRCGMINEKSSKTLLSEKRGCRFIPCHARGALSLQYVKSVAAASGIEVTHALEGVVPLDRLEISADEKLSWRKEGRTMTQSWNQVRKRALSVKQGTLFQPDGTRRKLPSPVLGETFLARICSARQLLPPPVVPARRADKVAYTHTLCSKPVLLRFSELEAWDPTQCVHCHPVERKALDAFLTYLADAEMGYTGTLRMMKGAKQVDRDQALSIECRICGHRNTPRTYDQVRYRGFLYCDNPGCRNTYPVEDRTGEPEGYYIELLRKTAVTSFAAAQQRFPRAIQYLQKSTRQVKKNGEGTLSKYELVRDALGFDRNAPSRTFSDAELRQAFQVAIGQGAENISQLRARLANDINNYITRQKATGDMIHHRILEEMKFRFKRSYAIESLEDAIACIKDTAAPSWSWFVTRYPGAGEAIIGLGYKEDILAEFGWTPLVNYSRLPDSALLDRAAAFCRDEQFTSLNQLERAYGSLVRNLRERRLVDRLCEAMGFEQTAVWQGMGFDALVDYIRQRGFASSSDWHHECSGSYKYAASQNWVRDVSGKFAWGLYKGLNGLRYDSLPETVVANLMYLSDYDFEDHPRIEAFPGYGGGRASGDFLLDAGLWVEVWAYRTDDVPPSGKFEKYPQVRRHKENGYASHGMSLCSIEGGLFYRDYVIDGEAYKRGLSNFVRHACRRLAAHGYRIDYDAELVSQLRKSVQNESASPMIQL